MREEAVAKEQGERVKSDDKEAQGEFIALNRATVALMSLTARQYPFDKYFF